MVNVILLSIVLLDTKERTTRSSAQKNQELKRFLENSNVAASAIDILIMKCS